MKVYFCKYKILGMPVAVMDEQKAKDWVSLEPEIRYYEEVEVLDDLRKPEETM